MNRNISGKVKKFVFERDKGKCVYCGSSENLEFDHIIPISKGGSNSERNIQLVCFECNRIKFDYIDDDFLRDGDKKTKKKRLSRKNLIPLYIPKEFVDNLSWNYGDRISALSLIYRNDIAFSLIKNRQLGSIHIFRLNHDDLGELIFSTTLLKTWLYNIKKDNYYDSTMQIDFFDKQKGLILIKKETELTNLYLKDNLYNLNHH